MTPLDLLASLLLTLALHATVLLGAAWALSKLVRPAWAEPLWRAALLGALLSTGVQGGVLVHEAAVEAMASASPGDVLAPRDDGLHDTVAADAARVDEASGVEGVPATDIAAAFLDAPAQAPSVERPVADTIASNAAHAEDVATSRAPALSADTMTSPASARHDAAATPRASARPVEAASLAMAPPTDRHVRAELPLLATALLLLAWLATTAVATLRLLRHWRALRAVAAHARAQALPVPLSMQLQVRRLADDLQVPAPTLFLVDGLASPMLAGRGRLLLPAWAPSLTLRQQQALLAHELAHVQRRDTTWKALLRFAALPLAFHPLAALALRRLDALAEDACDARAADWQGGGRPLAECLAACLHHHPRLAAAPALAVAMADEPGPVVRRVRNLLEDTPMSNRPLPTTHRRATLALALTAALVLPGLAITTLGGSALADTLGPGAFSSLFDGNGRQVYRETDDDGNVLRFELRGAVEFTADESDVAALGRGSQLSLERRVRGGPTHRVDIVAGKDGTLEHRYRVDGDDRPFDATARAWLAKELPTVLRETGLNAEVRGKRILERGGVDALLAEIELTNKDYATRRYLEVLFANAALADAQQQRALDAAHGIESDFELRSALQAMVAAQTLPTARQQQLLQVAASIGSDFELAETLSSLALRHAPTGETQAAWTQVLAGFGSDFELRRTLEALLATAPGPVSTALALTAATDGLSSDFEMRQLLEKTVADARRDAGVRAAWLAGLATIGSDFETREALVALIGKQPVDIALADDVLAAIERIGSDFEAREALVALAARMPADAGLVERYRAASRRLGNFERGEAERALDRFAAI